MQWHDYAVLALAIFMGGGLFAGLMRVLIYDFDQPVVPAYPDPLEQSLYDKYPDWGKPASFKDPAWTPEEAEEALSHGAPHAQP